MTEYEAPKGSERITQKLKLRPRQDIVDSTTRTSLQCLELRYRRPHFLVGTEYSSSWLAPNTEVQVLEKINFRAEQELNMPKNGIPAIVTNKWLSEKYGTKLNVEKREVSPTGTVGGSVSTSIDQITLKTHRHSSQELLQSVLTGLSNSTEDATTVRHEVIHLITNYNRLLAPYKSLKRWATGLGDPLNHESNQLLRDIDNFFFRLFPSVRIAQHPYSRAVGEVIARASNIEINHENVFDYKSHFNEIHSISGYATLSDAFRQGEKYDPTFTVDHVSQIVLSYMALGGTPFELSERIKRDVYESPSMTLAGTSAIRIRLQQVLDTALREKLLEHGYTQQLTQKDLEDLCDYTIVSGIEKSEKIQLIALQEERVLINDLLQSQQEQTITYRYDNESQAALLLESEPATPNLKQVSYLKVIDTKDRATESISVIVSTYDVSRNVYTTEAQVLIEDTPQTRKRWAKVLRALPQSELKTLIRIMDQGLFRPIGVTEASGALLRSIIKETAIKERARHRLINFINGDTTAISQDLKEVLHEQLTGAELE